MKTHKSIHKQAFNTIIACLFGFLFSCSCESNPEGTPDLPSDPNTIKIMPLGASRVEGARPDFESYRHELWKLMVDRGWSIDLIGTVDDEASYPSHSNSSFDNDHEGRGGWTSGQTLAGINSWLQSAGTPDIVLFSSPGGNDALTNMSYDAAVANINQIIDILQAANPNVTIIIEQMAPGKSEIMTGTLNNFFSQMQQEVLNISANQSTATSLVIAVDMFTGFQDNLLADDVHYNEAGARFIAQRYFQALQGVID